MNRGAKVTICPKMRQMEAGRRRLTGDEKSQHNQTFGKMAPAPIG
jgi:hypothetical protein